MNSIKKGLILVGCIIVAVILCCIVVNVALNSDPIVGDWKCTKDDATTQIIELNLFYDKSAGMYVINEKSLTGHDYLLLVGGWSNTGDNTYKIDGSSARLSKNGKRLTWYSNKYGQREFIKIEK